MRALAFNLRFFAAMILHPSGSDCGQCWKPLDPDEVAALRIRLSASDQSVITTDPARPKVAA